MADDLSDRTAESDVSGSVQMDTVHIARRDMLTRIDEDAPGRVCRLTVARSKLAGGPRARFELVGELLEPPERRRADEHDLRAGAKGTAIARLGELDELLRARGDLTCGEAEPVLQVVRAEHEDRQVEGLVGLERRQQELAAVSVRLAIVLAHRRPTVEARLDDPVPGAELTAEDPRPSHVRRESLRRLLPYERDAAPGIRVAVTEDDGHRYERGGAVDRRSMRCGENTRCSGAWPAASSSYAVAPSSYVGW